MGWHLKYPRSAFVAALAVALAALACNTPGAYSAAPTVTIQAPTSGAEVAIGQPVVIAAVATDPDGPGVTRVELFVNGQSVGDAQSPTGAHDVFDAAISWTPDAEGTATITVVAYRGDGAPSAPAMITLHVVGATTESTQPSPHAPASPSPTSRSPLIETPTGEGVVTGRVIMDANIRSGAGPFCDIIGGAETNEVINLLEYSADRRWFKTDYTGRTGWIWAASVSPLGNTARIPIGTAQGCQGCGDLSCNLDETCFTCPNDCGLCCGNGVCEAAYGEDCGACQADCGPCCGNGACEPGRGETCSSCQADCGPCCGNGACEPALGETCASCSADCGSCCGNGLCEANLGENCSTCSRDCGNCCGNGLCEASRGENCSTCVADCGACTPTGPSGPSGP